MIVVERHVQAVLTRDISIAASQTYKWREGNLFFFKSPEKYTEPLQVRYLQPSTLNNNLQTQDETKNTYFQCTSDQTVGQELLSEP